MATGLGAPALIVGIVGTISALLALAAWRAMLKTGNRGIYFVVAAFIVLSVKNLTKAFLLGTVGAEGANVELVFSLLDLMAIALFAWPILRRASGGAVR